MTGGEPAADPDRRPSVYEAAGGGAAMLRISVALHQRCRADPLLHHPFSRPLHPEHDDRFAAYLGEVLGGPPGYTGRGGTQSALMRMHLGEGGATRAYRDAFVGCFDGAVEAAGVPRDPELRNTLHDFMTWAASELMPEHDDPDRVEAGMALPRWTWEGPLRR